MVDLESLNLIEPEKTEIDGQTFVLSRLPAMAGKEIGFTYITGAMSKNSDYAKNQEMTVKLLSYAVAINKKGEAFKLQSPYIIDQHVKSWETLVKLEMAMIEYNTSFLERGQLLNLLTNSLQEIKQSLAETLTTFLPQ